MAESFHGELNIDGELETRKDERGKPFLNSIEKCVMHLMGELDVPSTKCGVLIQAVSKWIHHKNIDLKDWPSPSTCITMLDRAQVLSKLQVADRLKNCNSWDLHGNCTTRDHRIYLGHQFNIDGNLFSGGFSGLAVEDSSSLLDNAIAIMQELADIDEQNNKEELYKTFLTKMCATMSDRSSVEKLFHKKLNDYREQQVTEAELHFLYCNAHFLLGLSDMSEKALKELEAEMIVELGHGLGRDQSDKFCRFMNKSESATARLIRTGCDVLGPMGDEKNGCHHQWEAFLSAVTVTQKT